MQGPVPKALAESRQLSVRGVTAAETGDWQSAEKCFAQAIKACDADAEARCHYAEALWHRGQRDQAIEQMVEAARLTGDDDELRVRLAEMRLETGDLAKAKSDVDLAIDLNPRSARAWLLQGRILRKGGELRLALAAFQRSLAYSNENREALLESSETYRALGEPQRALASLQYLADSYPPGEEPQEVLYLEGLALVALDRMTDAVDTFAQAATRGTPNAEIWYHLAEAEERAGRSPEAWRDAQRALGLAPGHSAARDLLARLDRLQAGRPAAGPVR
jgi:tetratricopeptide (TPR) repeat protein